MNGLSSRICAFALCLTLVTAGWAQSGNQPVLVGQWPNYARGPAKAVSVQGNYAYVAFDQLEVLDISNPNQPVRVGCCDLPGTANGIAKSGSHVYVANSTNGLQVIFLGNPANPVRVGVYNTSGNAYKAAVAGNRAYIADEAAGLQIIDLTNPALPVWVGGYDTKGGAYGVAVTDNYVYVADGPTGLAILQIGGLPPRIAANSLARLPDGKFQFNIESGDQTKIEVQGSTDFINWSCLHTFTNPVSPVQFIDPATNYPRRFYRLK